MKDWNLKNKKVTIMGLGLHGGGLASARFFAQKGAQVTVTDFKDSHQLAPSIEKLADLPIRFVLGGHEDEDFSGADIVVKNPAVRKNNPYLAKARRIETDISTFLSFYKGPLIAVTGTKGKSTTASAIYHVLHKADPRAKLGGNITVSPLTFLEEIDDQTPVVLELSSWQLADLRSRGLLNPRVSIITNILPDHLNTYDGSMDLYVDDKRVIYQEQHQENYSLFFREGEYTNSFLAESRARIGLFGKKHFEGQNYNAHAWAWLEENRGVLHWKDQEETLMDLPHPLPGDHLALNFLCASMALRLFGLESDFIRKHIATFPGVAHRLELVAEVKGVRYYNDSAATIPEAANAALLSFPRQRVICITGGTDKELDFASLQEGLTTAKEIILLAGSGTTKLIPLLKEWELTYMGPFDNLPYAVEKAHNLAQKGDTVLLSPGCASFEMFQNEFHRGDMFRDLCKELN